MSYVFGQNITYWFYPLNEDSGASVPSGVQGQTPAIYVFDKSPTRDEASTGTNSLSTISSWTWNSTKNGWSFTVPAIDDPAPTSNIDVRTYYVAINFILESGEQTQTFIQPLIISRVAGHDKAVTISTTELETYLPQVTAYTSLPQRNAYILQAIEEVKGKLRDKGYEWARITRPDRLDMCVIYKTLAMIMLGQIQDSGDKFSIKYSEYKDNFESALENLKFEYKQQNIDGVVQAKASTVLLLNR